MDGCFFSDSIDDGGLRYMLALRHFIYLMRTLPIRQRAQLQLQGLSSAYLVWAFHSEAEEVSSKISNLFLALLHAFLYDLKTSQKIIGRNFYLKNSGAIFFKIMHLHPAPKLSGGTSCSIEVTTSFSKCFCFWLPFRHLSLLEPRDSPRVSKPRQLSHFIP